jgi:transcriptional regulator with XRE-family HTH domain
MTNNVWCCNNILFYDAAMPESVKREQLAELLYPIMKKRNLSVQALASAIGVQRQTCYAWLHEYRRPGLEMLRRLSRVLNIPLADLVAATYSDVNGARLESLLEVYLSLPEDKRRLLEALAIAVEAENKQHAD